MDDADDSYEQDRRNMEKNKNKSSQPRLIDDEVEDDLDGDDVNMANNDPERRYSND